jgi:hypothetical protein
LIEVDSIAESASFLLRTVSSRPNRVTQENEKKAASVKGRGALAIPLDI